MLEELTKDRSASECAIICSSELEKALKAKWAATGNGLGQLASSVEHQLPAGMAGRLRSISGTRNQAAHDPLAFQFINRGRYVQECEKILAVLDRGPAGQRSASTVSGGPVMDTMGRWSKEAFGATDGFSAPLIVVLAFIGATLVWVASGMIKYFGKAQAGMPPFVAYMNHGVGIGVAILLGIGLAMMIAARVRSVASGGGALQWLRKFTSIHVFIGLIAMLMIIEVASFIFVFPALLLPLAMTGPGMAYGVAAFFVTLMWRIWDLGDRVTTFWRSSLTVAPPVCAVALPALLFVSRQASVFPSLLLAAGALLITWSPLLSNVRLPWTSRSQALMAWVPVLGFFAFAFTQIRSRFSPDGGIGHRTAAVPIFSSGYHLHHASAAWWLLTAVVGVLFYLMIRASRKGKTQGSVFPMFSGNGPVSTGADFAGALTPVSARYRFKDVAGMDDFKRQILSSGKEAIKGGRNGILFFGEPGNGKTFMAEALAGELGLPYLKVAIGDLQSRWVGETTERLNGALQAAKRKPCLLFLDEIESIVPPRENMHDSGQEAGKTTAAFLAGIDELRRNKVVIVAATNHLDMVDSAAIREGRFDWRIEVPCPDQVARIALLSGVLAGKSMDASVLDAAARRLEGYSAVRVRAVAKELVGQDKTGSYTIQDFINAQRRLQGSHGHSVGEDAPGIDDLVLPPMVRQQLISLAGRMLDPVGTEAKGATVPSGVLFHGDPGNGKTMAARALAKDTGWSFLTATGADLCKPDGVRKLSKKAQDIRPCIIFLDEADGALANRDSWQARADAINDLLTVMDGSQGRMRDVLWVGATNRVDSIDPAMLRGGRFSEKIYFANPDEVLLESALAQWMESVRIALSFSEREAAQVLSGLSFASAREALQAAVNHVVGMGRDSMTTEDLAMAKSLVRNPVQDAR